MAANQHPIKIAMDAMGGDHAPEQIVTGAVDFANTGAGQVMLVGDRDVVQAELAKHDAADLPISIVPSEGVIREGESPATSLRQKPKSSILVATGHGQTGQGRCLCEHGVHGSGHGGRGGGAGTGEGHRSARAGRPYRGVGAAYGGRGPGDEHRLPTAADCQLSR